MYIQYCTVKNEEVVKHPIKVLLFTLQCSINTLLVVFNTPWLNITPLRVLHYSLTPLGCLIPLLHSSHSNSCVQKCDCHSYINAKVLFVNKILNVTLMHSLSNYWIIVLPCHSV